jgi:hypothetical protein
MIGFHVDVCPPRGLRQAKPANRTKRDGPNGNWVARKSGLKGYIRSRLVSTEVNRHAAPITGGDGSIGQRKRLALPPARVLHRPGRLAASSTCRVGRPAFSGNRRTSRG